MNETPMRVINYFKESTYPGIEENRYLIYDDGSVFDTKTGEFKKLTSNGKGYVYGKFSTDNGMRSIALHRLVAYDFVPGYSEETGHNTVDHINFDKDDNYYENLEWVTVQENNQRRYNNPNHNFVNPPTYYGEDSPVCKNDTEIIIRICELISQGKSIIQTFYEFGYKAQSENKTFYNLIYDIYHKRSWVHISDNYF